MIQLIKWKEQNQPKIKNRIKYYQWRNKSILYEIHRTDIVCFNAKACVTHAFDCSKSIWSTRTPRNWFKVIFLCAQMSQISTVAQCACISSCTFVIVKTYQISNVFMALCSGLTALRLISSCKSTLVFYLLIQAHKCAFALPNTVKKVFFWEKNEFFRKMSSYLLSLQKNRKHLENSYHFCYWSCGREFFEKNISV